MAVAMSKNRPPFSSLRRNSLKAAAFSASGLVGVVCVTANSARPRGPYAP
jgi:hypothetical protein